ncbi:MULTISPECIES: hypothetical protein [Providencia]|uniref:hypothetical protein n=1 Tax=Providencia TaxID=586 RepID=UPI000CFFD68B|nr:MULTISPECIES: hypothetical protein [unclassified Providencia]AVL75524.1 hypothetical protein CEQ08_18165 [Providencia rettgeri]UFK95926.1 hypothetical protein LMY39_07055 [Providencia rettgeri]
MFGNTASTQYNDWLGSIALDNKDLSSLSVWANNNNHINKNERIVGFQVSYSTIANNFNLTIEYTSSSFDQMQSSSNPQSLILSKQVTLSPHQLIDALTDSFKRINIVASQNGFE